MIQANELRIGNYLLFMEDSTVFEVTEINKSGIGVKNKEEETWIELDQFEGIKLTEKILLKYGFINHEYYENVFDNESMELMKKGDGFYFIECGSLLDDNYYEPKNKIEALHRLQNLFFALTGEELLIK